MNDQPPTESPAPPEEARAPYTVYILRCGDGSYYVGFAEDVNARLAMHRSGRASTYTARRLPVSIAYTEGHTERDAAILRARELKMWSRDRKAALISGDMAALERFNRPPRPPDARFPRHERR